ncbi:hypothetical protein ACWGKW_16105 [Streptomyces sp. NPDC054766]
MVVVFVIIVAAVGVITVVMAAARVPVAVMGVAVMRPVARGRGEDLATHVLSAWKRRLTALRIPFGADNRCPSESAFTARQNFLDLGDGEAPAL